MEEFTDYLGVWQHLVSCGRDGKVMMMMMMMMVVVIIAHVPLWKHPMTRLRIDLPGVMDGGDDHPQVMVHVVPQLVAAVEFWFRALVLVLLQVMMHSWARSQRPQDSVPPSVLALSPRGELAALHEPIDRTDQVGALVLI
jgi:hypothetical protein